MTTLETPVTVMVTESCRVAVVSIWHGPTTYKSDRISVKRAGGGGKRITVKWNHELDTMTNHAEAIKQYLELMNWGGHWRIGSTDTGAVAVWVGGE